MSTDRSTKSFHTATRLHDSNATHLDSSAPPPPDGAPVVPGYDVLAELDRGGMGVVYRAREVALDRDVALKVLQDRYAPDSLTAKRFVDEARITSQLQHPAIPPVHHVGRLADGRPFLAMKLIKGDTLADLLEAEPTNRLKYIPAFLQVCQAVAFAHARKVIHRDLKPANIMVGAFGEVQVMDWGLAKVLASRERQRPEPDPDQPATEIHTQRDGDLVTQAGSILGTPAFMAPEQAQGAVQEIDERSDVFGLGAVLCAILTGQPPYLGPDSDSIRLKAIRGETTEALARLDGCGADTELVALCWWCLATDRAARPRDADEVAKSVAAHLAAAAERARQAELEQVRAAGELAKAEAEAREQRKRWRVQLGLAAAVAVVAGLLGFGLWWQDRQETRRLADEAAVRLAARQKLDAALDRAEAAFRDDQLPAADAALDLAAKLFDDTTAPELRTRYDGLRADRQLVAELDRVWAKSNVMLDERVPGSDRRKGGLHFNLAAAQTGYPAALGSFADLAARLERSPIRTRLLAALDDWLPVARPEDRPPLADLLARVDVDPERNTVRRGYVEPERLKTLFANPPGESALTVAARAALRSDVPNEQALTVLRAAVARFPNDFRTQYMTGVRTALADPAVAVGYFRAAHSLQPDNLAAIHGLATALYSSGKFHEAVPLFLRAIDLDPGFGVAYLNLADAIKIGADAAPAIAYFERQVAEQPNRAMAHFGLGMALRDQLPYRPRAIAAFRRSLELDEANALAHNYLGYALEGYSPRAERMACYRRAIELDPGFAFPHYNLALALRANGNTLEALTEFDKALELFPTHTYSHWELGKTLARRNDLTGAETHLRRVIEINRGFADAYPDLGQVLMRANKPGEAIEVYRACAQRFPTWHAGYDGLLQSLIRSGVNVEAVRVYHEATVRTNPTWPAEVRRRLRYNAACAAALAADGVGRDAPPAADRPAFRRLAFDSLTAELATARKLAATNRAVVHQSMMHWLQDSDLISVREHAALEKLPTEEREGWVKLWNEVRDLREATAPLEQAPRPRAVKR